MAGTGCLHFVSSCSHDILCVARMHGSCWNPHLLYSKFLLASPMRIVAMVGA
jgi:hypothetical protein